MSLYDRNRQDRDACGIGFVADAHGRGTRAIVDLALEALCRVRHRGAVAADALTGDGAGVLLPLPVAILGAAVPEVPPDRIGAAMVFSDPDDPAAIRGAVADGCRAEGVALAAWREVPVEPAALGDRARATAPAITQAILVRPEGVDGEEAERRAFRIRRRAEAELRATGARGYIASLSFRTITYKALCAADQLAAFYPDLVDRSFEAWFALFHQRYSTNTTPTWERAQPFRMLGHNGEINTIRGNVALMRARAGRLGSAALASEDLLDPVVDARGSDSAILDEVLELLVRGGRDIRHSSAMLVPPAWEGHDGLGSDVRDFFRYHACLIEPWDGPAGLVMSDGVRVAAALDRNGLRPLRVAICDDGLVACASEAGAVSVRGHGRVRRSRLGPGEMVCVDPGAGGLQEDREIKRSLARRRPYGRWLDPHHSIGGSGTPVDRPTGDEGARHVAAGYTKEEFTVVLRPMAVDGNEPTSSMGDDTVQPPLAAHGRVVFAFLKQRFAQVTNPPIDHLRERHVLSLATRLGARAPLLTEAPGAAELIAYPSALLFPDAVDALVADGARLLDATFDALEGPDGLPAALVRLGEQAPAAVDAGAAILVVSDAGVSPDRIGIPSALAAGAVHHALLRAGLRSQASIVVACDDARETHHVACLLTNGTDAVCPRLALRSIAALARSGRLGGGVSSADAQRNYIHALEDGLLKVMSKMGISTLDSYRGAQIIEAIGLGPDVIERCFDGVSSPLGGLSLLELGADAVLRHAGAFGRKPVLANTGFFKFKSGGEFHAFNPAVIDALHASVGFTSNEESAAHELRRAVRTGDAAAYERFASLSDGRPPTEPRDLLEFVPAGPPVPVDEVEDERSIARRFSTGAMSHGALGSEAHETLAVALNMIGGAANSGEGGEDPARYNDDRNCAIKQVASGRFGVTPAYLAAASELQIKMAQGSKPGEGGQLPGQKVSEEIARLRHTVPGVALISPPPHHDIYSIEDLAQLIFDLKEANGRAAVSVKLVASEGVGTIAAGVVKGLADVVHVSGADGGTGASPLSSIKYAGMPWEVGLAETQAALVANDLRARARIRVDGGIRTGRDVVAAALLGADEYSFGTAALVAQGCILVRTCHRNTCPVGIATQDPKLRAKFAGTPEMVASYLLMVAADVRRTLAALGLRSLDDAIGRTDLLRQRRTGDARADSLDLRPLLARIDGERRFTGASSPSPRSPLGDRLARDASAALGEAVDVDLRYPITTSDRAVGARLATDIAARFGSGRPPGTVRVTFSGDAGQSFGAFLTHGIELTLVGEANDYVGKSMAGGRVAIRPPENDAGDPHLVGNTVLYGATGGRLFIAGRAGERFAVRNSGAVAVVEGTGDHACEYMTAGAVVILGPTGRNLGAGMSGGEAYVYDPRDELDGRLNPQLVAAYTPTAGQLESLRRVIRRHFEATGSQVALGILEGWAMTRHAFKRVAPVAEVARLEALFEGTAVTAA